LEKNKKLPDGWEKPSLDSCMNVISGFAFKSKDFQESGIPVVKISNVSYGDYLIKNQEFFARIFS